MQCLTLQRFSDHAFTDPEARLGFASESDQRSSLSGVGGLNLAQAACPSLTMLRKFRALLYLLSGHLFVPGTVPGIGINAEVDKAGTNL